MHAQAVLRRQHALLLACGHDASAGMAASLFTGHCACLAKCTTGSIDLSVVQ